MNKILEIMMRAMLKKARKQIGKTEQIKDQILFETEDGVIYHAETRMPPARFAFGIRNHLKDTGFRRYVFMAEAWTASPHPDPKVNALAAAEREDKQEVLLLQGADADGTSLIVSYSIKRDDKNRRTLGKRLWKQSGTLNGPFDNFLVDQEAA